MKRSVQERTLDIETLDFGLNGPSGSTLERALAVNLSIIVAFDLDYVTHFVKATAQTSADAVFQRWFFSIML